MTGTQAPVAPKIETSKIYGLFKLMGGNRGINYNHVKELKRSMEAHPELLPTNPIEVNENMYIIDGQHRWAACKELGLPVYYIVNEGGTLDATRIENVTQRRWSLMDFAHSYAEGGNKDYKMFLRMVHDFPKIQASVIQMVCNGGNRHNAATDFRRGEFVIVDQDFALKSLTQLEEIAEKTHQRLNTPMATQLFFLMRDNKDFSYDRFIEKLEREGARDMFRMANTRRLCLQSIENVYSFQAKIPVRFY